MEEKDFIISTVKMALTKLPEKDRENFITCFCLDVYKKGIEYGKTQ